MYWIFFDENFSQNNPALAPETNGSGAPAMAPDWYY
jgi:hypothetical protein